MIEIIHQEQTEEKVQRELPREIKQIGSPDAGERIYVEDTVYRRMHPHGGVEEKTAYVLLGKFENCMGRECTFVEAVIPLNDQEQQQQGINNNDLTVSKSLVSTYIVILNNDVVMDKVGTKLLKQYSEEELQQYFTVKDGKVTDASLKSCFQMTAVDQTEVLKITATTKNAELSSTLCNIMADVAPDFLIRVVGAGSVEKIGDAKVYDTPVSPNVMKNTALGFAAGIMLAVLVILVIDFFDNTVKDTAELNEKFQKPIIGEIQNIGGKVKKKDRGTSA